MLEASGFDFRNRYPQRLVLKLAKVYGADKATLGKTAYNMSLDLYRTFAPLKQTTPTMAVACVELAGRVLGKPVSELESGKDYKQWRIARQEVMGLCFGIICFLQVRNYGTNNYCRNTTRPTGSVYPSSIFHDRRPRSCSRRVHQHTDRSQSGSLG